MDINEFILGSFGNFCIFVALVALGVDRVMANVQSLSINLLPWLLNHREFYEKPAERKQFVCV